jgi:uncharacterized protein (DUF58 family)
MILSGRERKAHYNACRDALYTLRPVGNLDYRKSALFFIRLRRRALLVFLTDLNDPILAESFVRSSKLTRCQHPG